MAPLYSVHHCTHASRSDRLLTYSAEYEYRGKQMISSDLTRKECPVA
ncbi:MAG: hypothetical protein HWQ42_22360 [Nostoc sp. JL23]|nr:hypothetical protein [Nostoc sp. JL23]